MNPRSGYKIAAALALFFMLTLCSVRNKPGWCSTGAPSIEDAIAAHRAGRIDQIRFYHLSGVRWNYQTGGRPAGKRFSIRVMGSLVRRDLEAERGTFTELIDSNGELHSFVSTTGGTGEFRSAIASDVLRKKAFLMSAETASLIFFLSRLTNQSSRVVSCEQATADIDQLNVMTGSSEWKVFVHRRDHLIRRIVVGGGSSPKVFEFDDFAAFGDDRVMIPRLERVYLRGRLAFVYAIESVDLRASVSPQLLGFFAELKEQPIANSLAR